MAMRAQNNRIRPEDPRARGTKTRMPESNRRHWITSLKAVSRNECGRIRAASANTARQPMTPTDQSLEPMAKTLPRTHSRASNNRNAGYCSNLGLTSEITPEKAESHGRGGPLKFLLL